MQRRPAAEEVSHPLFARVYARLSEGAETRGTATHRKHLLSDLAGRVVEIGAGNGLNFAHYPSTVTHVSAVEPEPSLRAHAERAAAVAPVPVSVVAGTAAALPLSSGDFDAVVFSLVLCSVPDQAAALSEARRLLKPGGELRFYEHVKGRRGGVALGQRVADRTFWPHIAGGCHLARDTEAAILNAGFQITHVRRFAYSPARLLPSAPHILGTARSPS